MSAHPMVAPTDGPPTSKQISGSVPGLLDPAQPERLLRMPDSKLSFAAFDPRAASGPQEIPDLRKLSLNEELYRPKRVVIETTPSGESFWRFVPKARREEGVLDEGKWPRVVEICGELVECSLDQWDIYKLDPEYDCYVRQTPDVTVIIRVPPRPKAAKLGPDQHFTKRRMSTVSPEKTTPPPNSRKKVHTKTFESSSDEDEQEEVEEMIIDDQHPRERAKSSGPREQAKKFREEVKKNRKERREKLTRRAEKLGGNGEEVRFDFTLESLHSSQSVPPENAVKRKVSSLFDSLRSQDDPDYTRPPDDDYLRNTTKYAHAKHYKRTRTSSPSSAKRDLEAKRLEREKLKRERRERELDDRRQARYQKFMEEVYADVPDFGTHVNGTDTQNDADAVGSGDGSGEDDNQDGSEDEESARQATIAESRRKLAELEADRPIWEEQARKRAMWEKAEQEAQWAKAEERRRAEAQKVETERRAKAQREEQEMRRREEALKREREEMARREWDKRQRQQRWSYGPWTVKRALERYKTLSEVFDGTKFSPNEPLTLEAVPWPVLQSPVSFSVEDVDWGAVEKFFDAVRHEMRPQDYASFVEKSHRRFHPDRWRSRGLLKSVVDDAERGCLEVAANTVAQALTPLWRDITGR